MRNSGNLVRPGSTGSVSATTIAAQIPVTLATSYPRVSRTFAGGAEKRTAYGCSVTGAAPEYGRADEVAVVLAGGDKRVDGRRGGEAALPLL